MLTTKDKKIEEKSPILNQNGKFIVSCINLSESAGEGSQGRVWLRLALCCGAGSVTEGPLQTFVSPSCMVLLI